MSYLPRIAIADIMAMSLVEVWSLPEERHVVVFSDGEVETHTRATILTRYLMNQLTFHSTEIPTKRKWHVQISGKDGKSGEDGRSQKNVLADVYWTIQEFYEANGQEAPLHDMDYEVINTQQAIYNDFAIGIEGLLTSVKDYETTTSLIDLLAIADDPRIDEINRNIVPTQVGIEEHTYKPIADIILNDDKFKRNPIQIGLKSGSYPMGQVLQCITARGYGSDIDNTIAVDPILTGYLDGITDIYGSLIESRDATRALVNNQELIQDTEVFNREMQLVACYIQRIHPGDCGSTTYVDIPVNKLIFNSLLGKYRVLPEGGLKAITPSDKDELMNKQVTIRSMLGCNHPDTQGVCEICYGRMSHNMVKSQVINGVKTAETLIGHVSGSVHGDANTSTVFATKHLAATSHIDPFNLGDGERNYLKVEGNENIYLKKVFHKKRFTITFLSAQLFAITDVAHVSDVTALRPDRVSIVTAMLVNLGKHDPLGSEAPVELSVYNYNRKPSLSMEALAYIKEKGWTYTGKDKYVTIDFSDFDRSHPILVLPPTHVTQAEYSTEFKNFSFSVAPGGRKSFGRGVTQATSGERVLTDYKDLGTALVAFLNLNPQKLGSNIVHNETLMLALTCRDPKNQDFSLPGNAIEEGEVSTYFKVLSGRSAGPMMAYQKQTQYVHSSLRNYLRNYVDYTPLDDVLTAGVNIPKGEDAGY